MFKPGDVAFFKTANQQPKDFPRGVKFPGWGFGVVLGCVPHGIIAPPASHVFRLMANAGFVALDDIGELLGQEALNTFVKAFETKYYGRTSDDLAKPGAPAPEEVAPPKLVGVDGKPLQPLTTKRVEVESFLPKGPPLGAA